jgi:hypothetical protein
MAAAELLLRRVLPQRLVGELVRDRVVRRVPGPHMVGVHVDAWSTVIPGLPTTTTSSAPRPSPPEVAAPTIVEP